MTNPQPWAKRQEIPDSQVRNAADQYETARRVLAEQALETAVVLPLINVAIMATELYLKSLGSSKVYTPLPALPAVSRVTALPDVKNHLLTVLFDAIPSDTARLLDEAYTREPVVPGQGLRELLQQLEGAFEASRYPFEDGMDVTRYPYPLVMAVPPFLKRFVDRLQPTEWVHWK